MTGKLSTLLSAAALIALLGGSGYVITSAQAQGGGMTMSRANFDRHFMVKAAQGNVAEVMTSQLALRKSRNRSVRETADRLIREHSEANSRLKQIAGGKGIRLPNRPDPMQRAVYNRLAKLSGPAFDRAFMGAQIRAHLNAISLHQNEVRAGKDAAAVAFASETLPRIQDHTTMIVSVAQNLGVRIPPAAAQYRKVQNASGMGM